LNDIAETIIKTLSKELSAT